MNNYDDLDKDVVRILEGWFGESLKDMEDEIRYYKHLYKPLSDLVKDLKEQKAW